MSDPDFLGARLDEQGASFGVFAPLAERVQLCLFEGEGASSERRVDLELDPLGVWRASVPGLRAGQAYGYRASGPWDPARGLFFNPHKLLVDPYARALDGEGGAAEELRSFDAELEPDERDSAPWVPRSLVVEGDFDWQGDRAPAVPWEESVIYEAHVRGLTQQHPDVPPELRGTYAALACEPVIEHLRALGVTALELLPVHAHPREPFLAERGLSNYWGYATIGFFAPHPTYAASGLAAVTEFKQAVRALHAAGIEVILDVVYNHTPESGPGQPTWSLRGLDPRYYRRDEDGHCEDFTGCGNTLDTREPHVLRLILDSLRWWVEEFHVDGFRFDLAPALARLGADEPPEGGFWAAVSQDPILRRCKLIAEPWDLGHGGYRLGQFPRGWAEWNGQYRDTVRRFWRGDAGQLPELGRRLSGSADHFWERGPRASINYVTCHDGFTLHDWVSYSRKRNGANGEQNRDGHEPSYSSTWGGPEGPAEQASVRARRLRVKRSVVATLACSLGVPMLNMGDELSRTQGGNNNAYCQDNPTSWVDWSGGSEPQERALFLDFVQRAFALRRSEPALRAARHPDEAALRWLRPEGEPMRTSDWEDPEGQSVAALLAGERELLLLLNAKGGAEDFRLPEGTWEVLLDSEDDQDPQGRTAQGSYCSGACTLVVLGRA